MRISPSHAEFTARRGRHWVGTRVLRFRRPDRRRGVVPRSVSERAPLALTEHGNIQEQS